MDLLSLFIWLIFCSFYLFVPLCLCFWLSMYLFLSFFVFVFVSLCLKYFFFFVFVLTLFLFIKGWFGDHGPSPAKTFSRYIPSVFHFATPRKLVVWQKCTTPFSFLWTRTISREGILCCLIFFSCCHGWVTILSLSFLCHVNLGPVLRIRLAAIGWMAPRGCAELLLEETLHVHLGDYLHIYDTYM